MSSGSEPGAALLALLQLMARLRDPQRGCPWDREQTFRSIAPYTIEEAYEVADAVERGEPGKLRDELGDLLFQVVFHARMAEEQGWFDFAAVAHGIHEKLIRRHPHVFEDPRLAADVGQLSRIWEEQKARERAQAAGEGAAADHSALADVPRALPALTRAAKLGKRAARVGFDWEHASQVRDKVLEEVREIDEALGAHESQDRIAEEGEPRAGGERPALPPRTAIGTASDQKLAEEMGDLLFAVANWSLHLNIDPEEALRAANAKFERRFRHMEALAAAEGQPLQALDAAEWDVLWRQAKREV
ncbi:MAG TPA: nucleoside triphosphate pyrophosphohydrolase [Steroidobacteraceae bacterium]|nr:nucleoside triphosphate pyrophosphohydrolase [Steroidobacteraceae bacterium]